MNTIERLNTLPEPYRALALAEVENVRKSLADDPKILEAYSMRLNTVTYGFKSAIYNAFSFLHMPQNPDKQKRYNFWEAVSNSLTFGKKLPPIPDFYK